jgi:hypothetical protein
MTALHPWADNTAGGWIPAPAVARVVWLRVWPTGAACSLDSAWNAEVPIWQGETAMATSRVSQVGRAPGWYASLGRRAHRSGRLRFLSKGG